MVSVDIADLSLIQTCVVLDAVRYAAPVVQERRAEEFARVGTPRCDEISLALRRKAFLLRKPDPSSWRLP